MNTLAQIIPKLPETYPLPVMIVQHRLHDANEYLVEHLRNLCDLQVKTAESRAAIQAPCVYIAPSGYHLLVERDRSFSLSIDPKVNYAIPSIDVLFETAADAYQEKRVGVILTGANCDDCRGLESIKKYGGLSIVQDPATAASSYMPSAAINIAEVDHIIPLNEIGIFLKSIANWSQ
ncbi:MAG: chemotaxis protein CheB [Pseudomonadales bacterium]